MELFLLLGFVFLVSVMTSLVVARRLVNTSIRGRIPERSRQWSSSRVPRIGGVAVFLALAVSVSLGVLAKSFLSERGSRLPDDVLPLIVSAAILFSVGLLDDLRGVKPISKLAAQTLAALIVYNAGFSIRHVSLFSGQVLELGFLSLPVTALWLVGVSNAFNLVDGMDGLAGGVAIIGLLAVEAAGLFLGNPTIPVYTIALIGALIGFLRYNWPSARLFMGDSGSLVVGFLLAVLSVKAATDPQKITFALVPIFALGYPLLDTAVAMLRRWLRGVPLSRADHRHIHHRLGTLGIGPTRSLFVIYGASVFAGSVGLMATFAPPEVTFIATTAGIAITAVVVTVGISWLQYHEFSEAGSSIASAARKAPFVIRDRIQARDLAALIRESNTFEAVQNVLEDSAPVFRFAYMKLSTPQSKGWSSGRITKELHAQKMWKLEYPVVLNNPEQWEGMCLTIWCDLNVSQRPVGAERVAQILVPAIVDWVANIRSDSAPMVHPERRHHPAGAREVGETEPRVLRRIGSYLRRSREESKMPARPVADAHAGTVNEA